MTASPPARTPDELGAALADIGYELQMVCGCAYLIQTLDDTKDALRGYKGVRSNALLESELVHLRSLIEFFFRPSGRDDDVGTHEFARNRGWPPKGLVWTEVDLSTDTTWDLINKRLAHITWDRTKPNKGWKPVVLAHDMLGVAIAWAKHLDRPQPKLASAWRAEVFVARQALEGKLIDPAVFEAS
jgi:hypothetical protein